MTGARATPRFEIVRKVVRVGVALAMAAVGTLHFVDPAPFVRIVPAALPAPELLVYLSGACEIAFGLLLLVPRVRKLASFGLVALFVAVFPANINMALHHIQLSPGGTMPIWAMWARLPFQLVFIALAIWVGRDGAARSGRPSTAG